MHLRKPPCLVVSTHKAPPFPRQHKFLHLDKCLARSRTNTAAVWHTSRPRLWALVGGFLKLPALSAMLPESGLRDRGPSPRAPERKRPPSQPLSSAPCYNVPIPTDLQRLSHRATRRSGGEFGGSGCERDFCLFSPSALGSHGGFDRLL